MLRVQRECVTLITSGSILFIIVGAIALALVIGLIGKRARVRRIPHPAPVDPETARIQWQQRAAVEREARRPQRLQQLEQPAVSLD